MSIFYNDLWNKSKAFIERAISKRNQNELGEFQLWASLTLEILGKATLSSIHPSLVVDTKDDAKGLLVACGHTTGDDFKTIAASTVFKRCKELIKVGRFHDDAMNFCVKLANRRNADLHSGALPFEGMRLEAWLPKYWDVCKMLLDFQGKTLVDFIGEEEAKAAEEIIADNSKALQKAIQSRIEKHKRDIEERHGGSIPAAIRDASSLVLEEEYELLECPSCGREGLAQGELIDEQELDADPEEPSWVVRIGQAYDVTSFRCIVCDLKLNNLEEITLAGMETEFTRVIEMEPDFEPDYGND